MKILTTVILLYILCLFSVRIDNPYPSKVVYSGPIKHFKQDLKCLAAALYVEARGEGRHGMEIVANVVLNRVEKRKKSVCEIIKQKGQFQWYKGRMPSVPVQYVSLAEQLLMKHLTNELEDVTNGAMFFMRNEINNNVTRKHELVYRYKNHSFYR